MYGKTLLSEIVHCPHARECQENPSAENPCRKIVNSQNALGLEKFQVPEPWSGQIEQAPILFLSSNPSIGSDEDYPNWDWSCSIDYALTEIVHCKSRAEIGVEESQSQCVEAYLLRILELAGAKVIVVLWARVKQVIQSQFNISTENSI